MSKTYKAKEATIVLGTALIKVFQLPDGTYRLSQTQVTDAIGKRNRSIIEFLGGKSPEALPHKSFELSESLAVEGANKPITPIPISVATAYWRYWDKKGNPQASAIIDGCVQEAIERRADAAFGVFRSEEEYNQRLSTTYSDSVFLLQQVNQLIEIIRVNITASQALNRAIHTLMHNQSTTLRAAYDQANALLRTIRMTDSADSSGTDQRLTDMEEELRALGEQIAKVLPPE